MHSSKPVDVVSARRNVVVMITVDEFRQIFPEFGSSETYPYAQVKFWLTNANDNLNIARFGAQADLVTMLYVAHNLALASRATTVGSVRGTTGVVSSKSVGSVSVSYDISSSTTSGAGIYNTTSYGQRLMSIMRAMTAGPGYRVPLSAWNS